MKINGITNTINFGLKKTKGYVKVENELIQSEKTNRKEAKTLAHIISGLLPDAVLDYSKDFDKFVLRNEKMHLYDVGGIDKNQPLATLNNLYTHLWSLQHNNGKGCRQLTEVYPK